MSLFSEKMLLGSITRSDAQAISMGYQGDKPVAGDVVKIGENGKVQLTAAAADIAYGVVTHSDEPESVCVVTSGHVLARLEDANAGSHVFGTLTVVQAFASIDTQGNALTSYEVKVG